MSSIACHPIQIRPPIEVGGNSEHRRRTARLLAHSREEIARLALILDELGQSAVIRAVDGSLVAPPSGVNDAWLSAPIYDETGAPFAALELAPLGSVTSDISVRLAKALIDATARAITERWFRASFLRQWIVAARTMQGPNLCIMLAVEADRSIVGADHETRRLLDSRGHRFADAPKLSALLESGALPFLTRRDYDLSMTLLGSEDAVPWMTLITPPPPGGLDVHLGERMLIHSRPRLDTLTRLNVANTRADEHNGLPPRMLRRIQDHIDAHLSAPLNVETLAGDLGISVSHFARCFRRSVGLTPHSYVMRRRLHRAQELLSQTDLAIADIALQTGFSDQSHFSRRFHQMIGLPPKAFRVQHR